jgi:hypothetical protein
MPRLALLRRATGHCHVKGKGNAVLLLLVQLTVIALGVTLSLTGLNIIDERRLIDYAQVRTEIKDLEYSCKSWTQINLASFPEVYEDEALIVGTWWPNGVPIITNPLLGGEISPLPGVAITEFTGKGAYEDRLPSGANSLQAVRHPWKW